MIDLDPHELAEVLWRTNQPSSRPLREQQASMQAIYDKAADAAISWVVDKTIEKEGTVKKPWVGATVHYIDDPHAVVKAAIVSEIIPAEEESENELVCLTVFRAGEPPESIDNVVSSYDGYEARCWLWPEEEER